MALSEKRYFSPKTTKGLASLTMLAGPECPRLPIPVELSRHLLVATWSEFATMQPAAFPFVRLCVQL